MVTVLVVDGDEVNAEIVMGVLTRDGHRVLNEPDGVGGLACACFGRPNVIMLGESLAGPMTGLEVCRLLRTDACFAETPIIMTSGWTARRDVEVGRRAGCDGYLTKPFSPDELRTTLNAQLDRLRPRRRTK